MKMIFKSNNETRGGHLAVVIEWLITATSVYVHLVLILALLTRSTSMYLLNWNRKL